MLSLFAMRDFSIDVFSTTVKLQAAGVENSSQLSLFAMCDLSNYGFLGQFLYT
jgi:hypothetical protein